MKIVSLFESKVSDIVKSLIENYKSEFDIQSPYDINNGLCVEFSEELIELLGGENDKQFILSTDMFQTFDVDMAREFWTGGLIISDDGSHAWSKKLLDLYGWPKGYNTKNISSITMIADHQWVYKDGKHYDAESPNGVKNWFELQIFKNNKVFDN